MFKNLTKPRWIALTAFLLIMIYLFIRLSDWQFDRLLKEAAANKQSLD